MEEWSAILLTCVEGGWSKRISYDSYDSITDLLGKFDKEIQLLQPLHLRRIALLKITSSRGEKASVLISKLLEASKVADLPNLSPEALLLHLFLDKCPEGEDTKEIKSKAVEVLRKKSSRGLKVEREDIDDFLTFSKEMESCLL